MESDNEILTLLGVNIRKIRIQQNISQNQLAFETGLTREYINKLEAGKMNVTVNNLNKIANSLTVEIVTFFK